MTSPNTPPTVDDLYRTYPDIMVRRSMIGLIIIIDPTQTAPPPQFSTRLFISYIPDGIYGSGLAIQSFLKPSNEPDTWLAIPTFGSADQISVMEQGLLDAHTVLDRARLGVGQLCMLHEASLTAKQRMALRANGIFDDLFEHEPNYTELDLSHGVIPGGPANVFAPFAVSKNLLLAEQSTAR